MRFAAIAGGLPAFGPAKFGAGLPCGWGKGFSAPVRIPGFGAAMSVLKGSGRLLCAKAKCGRWRIFGRRSDRCFISRRNARWITSGMSSRLIASGRSARLVIFGRRVQLVISERRVRLVVFGRSARSVVLERRARLTAFGIGWGIRLIVFGRRARSGTSGVGMRCRWITCVIGSRC